MKDTDTHYDIYSILLADGQASFFKAIVNMAVNSPEVLSELLLNVPQTLGYEHNYIKPYESLYDRKRVLGISGGWSYSCPISDEEAVERLAERSARLHAEVSKHAPYVNHANPLLADKALVQTVHNLFRNNAAQAIEFLLSRVEPEVKREFYNAFLSPEELAAHAQVDIIVRRIDNEGKMTGNRGRYLVYTSKGGGEEQLLKFTHQASCAYLLMYLIDRKQKQGILTPIEVRENRQEFARLYHMVYDITDDDLKKRLQDLEYRKDEHGHFRTGRLKEIIYDIRKRMQERFVEYDESFFPYAMTANSHLAVSPDRIHFSSEAEDLPELFCFNNFHWR